MNTKSKLFLLFLFGIFAVHGSEKSMILARFIFNDIDNANSKCLGITHCYDIGIREWEIEHVLHPEYAGHHRIDYFMDDNNHKEIIKKSSHSMMTQAINGINSIIEDKVSDDMKKGIVFYKAKENVSNEQHIETVTKLLDGNLKVCVLTRDGKLIENMEKHFLEKNIRVIIYSPNYKFYFSFGLLACIMGVAWWSYRSK